EARIAPDALPARLHPAPIDAVEPIAHVGVVGRGEVEHTEFEIDPAMSGRNPEWRNRCRAVDADPRKFDRRWPRVLAEELGLHHGDSRAHRDPNLAIARAQRARSNRVGRMRTVGF